MAEREAHLADREAGIARMEAQLRVREIDLDGAFDEIADLKEAVVRDAYAMVEVREAQVRETARAQVDDLYATVKRWMEPLTTLHKKAVAETGLLQRVRAALATAPSQKIREVRAALHRVEVQSYDPGRLGQMQRDQDAERLKQYRSSIAKMTARLEREEHPEDRQGSGVTLDLPGEERGGPV